MSNKQFDRVRCDLRHLRITRCIDNMVLADELLQHRLDQKRNIFAPIAERWNSQHYYT